MNLDELGQPGSAIAFESIAISDESTVVAEFFPEDATQARYQSEAELETAFITLLQAQAYEYLRITSAVELEANLRVQLETLNKFMFSDDEWKRLVAEKIAGRYFGLL